MLVGISVEFYAFALRFAFFSLDILDLSRVFYCVFYYLAANTLFEGFYELCTKFGWLGGYNFITVGLRLGF